MHPETGQPARVVARTILVNCLLLCRGNTKPVRDLAGLLTPLGKVRIVEDSGDIPGDFQQLTTLARTTAWDRAFNGIEPVDTWFVEDDVAGRREDFARLAELTAAVRADLVAHYVARPADEPAWPHWFRNPGFTQPWKSFNPICRLSGRLIGRVQKFREERGAFAFHEILFASLAEDRFDLANLRPGVTGTFRWRPPVSGDAPGIHHPVKRRVM